MVRVPLFSSGLGLRAANAAAPQPKASHPPHLGGPLQRRGPCRGRWRGGGGAAGVSDPAPRGRPHARMQPTGPHDRRVRGRDGRQRPAVGAFAGARTRAPWRQCHAEPLHPSPVVLCGHAGELSVVSRVRRPGPASRTCVTNGALQRPVWCNRCGRVLLGRTPDAARSY